MTEEIYYKGKGEHSVSELQTIVEQQKEKLYQLQIEKQTAIKEERNRLVEGIVNLNYVDSNQLRMGSSQLQREWDKLSITNIEGYEQAKTDIINLIKPSN